MSESGSGSGRGNGPQRGGSGGQRGAGQAGQGGRGTGRQPAERAGPGTQPRTAARLHRERALPAHPPGRSRPARGLRGTARRRLRGCLRQPRAARQDPPPRPGQARRRLRHGTELRRTARPGHLRRHPGPLRGPAARPAGSGHPRRAPDRRPPAAGHARPRARRAGPDRRPGPRRDWRRTVGPHQRRAAQSFSPHPRGVAGPAAERRDGRNETGRHPLCPPRVDCAGTPAVPRGARASRHGNQ